MVVSGGEVSWWCLEVQVSELCQEGRCRSGVRGSIMVVSGRRKCQSGVRRGVSYWCKEGEYHSGVRRGSIIVV